MKTARRPPVCILLCVYACLFNVYAFVIICLCICIIFVCIFIICFYEFIYIYIYIYFLYIVYYILFKGGSPYGNFSMIHINETMYECHSHTTERPFGRHPAGTPSCGHPIPRAPHYAGIFIYVLWYLYALLLNVYVFLLNVYVCLLYVYVCVLYVYVFCIYMLCILIRVLFIIIYWLLYNIKTKTPSQHNYKTHITY